MAIRKLMKLLGCAVAMTGAVAAQASTLKDICGECRFEKLVTCGQFLEGINFDGNGDIWAVSLFNGAIVKVVGGQCVTQLSTGGNPNGARFHKDGRLFITDNARGILTYDPRSRSLTVFADKVEGKSFVANDLVFDEQGGIYVTLADNSNYLDRVGRVAYFAPGTRSARILADRLPYPNGVALTPDGKFVNIGLYGAKAIMTMPSVANAQSKRGPYILAHTDGGIGPDGMTMDADGRLYWAEFLAGAVGVADMDGFTLGYMKLPKEAGRWTTNLTIHDGYLYVTEAEKGEIWRTPVTVKPQS